MTLLMLLLIVGGGRLALGRARADVNGAGADRCVLVQIKTKDAGSMRNIEVFRQLREEDTARQESQYT